MVQVVREGFLISTEAVVLSKIMMGVFRNIARAIATLCFLSARNIFSLHQRFIFDGVFLLKALFVFFHMYILHLNQYLH